MQLFHFNASEYLTHDGFFGTTDGFKPLLPQNCRSLWNTVKMTRVFSSLVSRTKFTVRKTACCRHDVHSGLPAAKDKNKEDYYKDNVIYSFKLCLGQL